ncbi:hypothetical protein LTR56_004266 [Elasticomyces elasticus]|nr:hypothetical protein LTR22_020671 [Elasticomyces elasticus]KAK3653856.1 hypothetical protein LTR56_004266 [Elasticomyces elasticus]KAK4919349.1 hypothetical protein LTR49_013049 [Elasticomyces elasticus]KAK5749679.1 hypothetical protein LTS12_020248 [Elasticomyces elasticus]
MAQGKSQRTTTPSRTSERLQLAKVIEASKTDTKIVKKKRFRRPRQRKSCHLFKLPGELRNRVYEAVLVSRGSVAIRPKGPGEPALLRVCKGIRAEARSIYYGANNFRLVMADFNGAAFTPFSRQYRDHEYYQRRTLANTGKVTFSMLGVPNWANLMRWLEDIYYCRALEPDLSKPIGNDQRIVGAALKVVNELKFKTVGGWSAVEKVLHAMHQALKGTSSYWGKD